MNNGISVDERKKLVIELAVHGNREIYNVFKKLGFNDVQSVVDVTLNNQAIVERLEKRYKYLNEFKGIRKEWHDRTVENLKSILETTEHSEGEP